MIYKCKINIWNIEKNQAHLFQCKRKEAEAAAIKAAKEILNDEDKLIGYSNDLYRDTKGYHGQTLNNQTVFEQDYLRQRKLGNPKRSIDI